MMSQSTYKKNNTIQKSTCTYCVASVCLSLLISACSDSNIPSNSEQITENSQTQGGLELESTDANTEILSDVAKTASTKFINEIPDYTQNTLRGVNTGNGQQFCAPVAVSNSLMWLHKNIGYEYLETELFYPEHTPQEGIILQLASEFYMNTSLKNGTSVNNLLKGVDKYVEEQFGGYKVLEYEGWREHNKKYTTGTQQPNQYRLFSNVNKDSAVWINIGWYMYDKSKDTYTRKSGHWVTLVGFHNDKLIIHDPATANKGTSSNELISYSILRDGTLAGEYKGLPLSANGFIQLTEGINIKPQYDVAILDGAVYLQL